MANIGLKRPSFATLESVPKTGVIGKAISADIAITASDVKLYGDDGVAESDRGFQSGTVSVNVTDLSTENQAILLGHDIDESGEMVANASDIPPYVKFGFYGRKRVAGADSFRAIVLHKVQFGEPSDENATKGETITFGTPTIEGTILTDDDGNWKSEQTFETEALAQDYLDDKLGIVKGE